MASFLYKVCDNCRGGNNVHHEGWTSVYQELEGRWFCSFQCMHAFKYGKQVYAPTRDSNGGGGGGGGKHAQAQTSAHECDVRDGDDDDH